MTKIDKNDLENINFLKKELKLKNIQSIKIKKGNYEIEISSNENIRDQKKQQISLQDGSLLKTEQKIKQNIFTFFVFIPIEAAALVSPPVAYIQLPTLLL